MDEVAETGREIVITKRGKPVARLAPVLDGESVGERRVPDPGLGARRGSHPHPSPLPQVRGRRGRPSTRRRGAPFGLYRDEIRIHGDIGAPIDVEWDAEANPDRPVNRGRRGIRGQPSCAENKTPRMRLTERLCS
ncbi:MAG: type II toxin-antitoxin system Phd/YefM family antitoxin [Chloroflexi bacterium]|nr:type II toxin-antitoxin system Phd/YefM family antitoxin [Chloroflexota bacterium]